MKVEQLDALICRLESIQHHGKRADDGDYHLLFHGTMQETIEALRWMLSERRQLEERAQLLPERQKIIQAVGQSCSAMSNALLALQPDVSKTLGFSIGQQTPDLKQQLAAAISAWAFLGDPDDIIAELDWQNIAQALNEGPGTDSDTGEVK